MNNNFKWLVNDIYNSIVINLCFRSGNRSILCGTFEVLDVLNTTGDELDIEFANIDDMTNLLTMGMVRFVRVDDIGDIIDIPFRNMYKLYEKVDGENSISLEELDAFAIFDGALIDKGYSLEISIVQELTDEMKKMIDVASKFGDLGMQANFDALTEVNMINYKRIQNDKRIR